MSDLSVSNRVQWALIGLVIASIFFSFTYFMYMIEGESISFALYFPAVIGFFILRQLVFMPPSISFERWLSERIRPGYYAIPESGGTMKIIRQVFVGTNEVYDLDGTFLGQEQDLWDQGDWGFLPTKKAPERMPAIAFWRTKRRKPIGML